MAAGGYVGMLRSAVLDRDGKPVNLAVEPPGPPIVGSVTGVLAGRVLVVPPVIRVGWLGLDVVGGFLLLVVGVFPPPPLVVGVEGLLSVVPGGGGGSS